MHSKKDGKEVTLMESVPHKVDTRKFTKSKGKTQAFFKKLGFLFMENVSAVMRSENHKNSSTNRILGLYCYCQYASL